MFRRLLFGGLAATLVGCLEPKLQPCGDRLCASDAVCLPSGDCATREAVDACTNQPVNASCSTTLFDGACLDGVCTPTRCGDGLVSGAEQCDGVVRGHDCVEFGFDLGVPTCNDRCDLDLIGGCTRFGWRRLSKNAVFSAWADGTGRLALVREPGRSVEMHDGADVITDSTVTWSYVTGNATTAVVWTSDTIAVYDSTAKAWVIDPDAPSQNEELAIAPDGTLYVTSFGECQVNRKPPGGSWSVIPGTSGLDCEGLALTAGGILVGFTDGTVRKWAGSWQTLFTVPSTVVSLVEQGGDIYVGPTSGGVVRWNGTQLATLTTGAIVYEFAATTDHVFFDNGTTLTRIDGDRLERFDPPIGGWLFVDPAGTLYTYGNGVYRFTGIQYGDHEGFDGLNDDFAQLSDGSLVGASVANMHIGYPDGDGYWIVRYPSIDPRSVTGSSTSDLLITDGESLEHFDGTTFTSVAVTAAFTGVADLYARPGGPLFAVGADSLILARTGTTWTTHAAPTSGCDLASVQGDAAATYIVGDCAGMGIVWKWTSGTTWTEIYRGGGPLAGITTTGDGELIAVGPSGGAWTRGGVWQPVAEAVGLSVGATTMSDVFVAGGPDDVIHWNGTEWSRLAVSGSISPRVIATPHTVYIVGTNQFVLLR